MPIADSGTADTINPVPLDVGSVADLEPARLPVMASLRISSGFGLTVLLGYASDIAADGPPEHLAVAKWTGWLDPNLSRQLSVAILL